MVDKAIYEIEINDDAFKRFGATYKKFQEEIGQTPEAWAHAARHAEQGRNSFEKALIAVRQQYELLQKRLKINVDFKEALEGAEVAWSKMSGHAKQFAFYIKDSLLSLMKWTGLSTLFSGIFAAGGIYGIMRMGQGVSAARTTAKGLGVSYGELKAFQSQFGFLNADAVLRGFGGALTDVRQRTAIYQIAGKGAGQILAGGTAGRVAARMMPHIQALAKRADARSLKTIYESYNVAQLGVSFEEFQMLRQMTTSEVAERARAFETNVGPMGVTDEVQRKFQDFITQVEETGAVFKTALERNLVNLAPSVSHLADSIVHFAEALLQGKHIQQGMKVINDKLLKWARDVSGEPTHYVDQFLNFVKEVSLTLERILGSPITKAFLLGWAVVRGTWETGAMAWDWTKQGWRKLNEWGDRRDRERGVGKYDPRHAPAKQVFERMRGIGAGARPDDAGNPYTHIGGQLKIEKESYEFGSGKTGQYAHIPYGDYPITPGTIGAWGQAHGALGINYNDIYDPALKRHRQGIELHPGSSDDLITQGCIAIAGSRWREFKAHVLNMIQRYGTVYLHVGRYGASVTPSRQFKDTPEAKNQTPSIRHGAKVHPQLQGQKEDRVTIHNESGGQVHSETKGWGALAYSW